MEEYGDKQEDVWMWSTSIGTSYECDDLEVEGRMEWVDGFGMWEMLE